MNAEGITGITAPLTKLFANIGRGRRIGHPTMNGMTESARYSAPSEAFSARGSRAEYPQSAIDRQAIYPFIPATCRDRSCSSRAARILPYGAMRLRMVVKCSSPRAEESPT